MYEGKTRACDITGASNTLPEVFCAIPSSRSETTLGDRLSTLEGACIFTSPTIDCTTVILNSKKFQRVK